jgi:HAD superfamily hydrolase (TIGR01509 family)
LGRFLAGVSLFWDSRLAKPGANGGSFSWGKIWRTVVRYARFVCLPRGAGVDSLPRMRRWPGAILFDFDGVIVNSEPLHFFAFQKTLAEEKIGLSEAEYYQELIGFDDRGAFKYLFAKHRLKPDQKTLSRLMTRKSEIVWELIEEKKYHALDGAEELVRGLWRHYPLGICSGALREEIEAMLEGVSLRDCFSVIVAAEDVTVGKPDPRGYVQCMKLVAEKAKCALTPADCLIIEDAPKVIESVREAGFSVLGVTTSHSAEKLARANWVVKSLGPAEVIKKIPGLLAGV